MIPAAILLIVLVVVDIGSHILLWVRASTLDTRAADMVREAFAKEQEAIVKVKDYNLKNDAQDRELARLSKELKELREFVRAPAKAP